MALRIPVDFIKDVISSILLFAFFFGLCKLFFVFGSSDAGDLNREKEHQVPARFEEVSDLILEYRSNQNWTGTVYRDRETQIEYLYIWDGQANGGPAITRLWKKGE